MISGPITRNDERAESDGLPRCGGIARRTQFCLGWRHDAVCRRALESEAKELVLTGILVRVRLKERNGHRHRVGAVRRDDEGPRKGGGGVIEVGGRTASRGRHRRDVQRTNRDRNVHRVVGGVPEVPGDPGVEEGRRLGRRGTTDRVGDGELRLITESVGDGRAGGGNRGGEESAGEGYRARLKRLHDPLELLHSSLYICHADIDH